MQRQENQSPPQFDGSKEKTFRLPIFINLVRIGVMCDVYLHRKVFTRKRSETVRV